MKRLLGLTAAIVALLAACSDKPATEAGGGLDTKVEGPALPVDHPAVDVPKPLVSASPQRLAVRQLRNSFPVALGTELDGGAINWRVGNVLGLDTYNDTLGEADFIFQTEDNLEPSPLYLKFMDDAARDVCNRVLTADWARPNSTDRQFIRFVDKADTALTAPAKVNDNLRYLKLRLHGIKIDPADDTEIAPLRQLFTDVTNAAAAGGTVDSNDTKEGWRAVCVALLMAPEFHFY
ncbi:MAG: hypothetical protein ACJ790_17435 [Myxococcaceae bacterium]